MSDRLKNMLSIIGEHLLFAVLSLLLYSYVGTLLVNREYIYSIITALFFISSIYSLGWNLSKKHFAFAKEKLKRSDNPDGKPDYRIYDGFIIALPYAVLCTLLAVLGILAGNMWEVLYRFFEYAFIFIITDSDNRFVVWGAVFSVIAPYVAYGLGYIAGKNKKVFIIKYLPKLIYRSRE